MKYLLVTCLFLMGCTSKTEFGDCVGLGQEKNFLLNYKIDKVNLAVGVIFFQLVVPPIVVLSDQLYCPVSKKTTDELFYNK